jgi:hypothetical protein
MSTAARTIDTVTHVDREMALRPSRARRAGRKVAAAAALALACSAVIVAPASAELEQAFAGWLAFTAQDDFGGASEKLDGVIWWLDGQLRFRDDVGGYSNTLIRPGLGWAFSEQGSLLAGYTYIHSTPVAGPSFNEHQAWQQFQWSEPSGLFSRLWRTRLEQRFRDGSDDVGVRLRQLFRTSIPIREGSSLSIVGHDEVFFHLNDTDWGAKTGFDQNRFFIGFGWQASKKIALELGYMNFYTDKATGPNQLDHIVQLWMHLR